MTNTMRESDVHSKALFEYRFSETLNSTQLLHETCVRTKKNM